MTATSNDKWKEFARRLQSEDRQERIDALNTLAGLDDMPAIRLLLKGLLDLSSPIRKVAAEHVAGKEHPAIVPGLISLLDSDEFYVRNTVKNILQSLPPERVIPEIRRRLDDEHLERSLKIALIPLYASAGKQAVPMLKSFLGSPDKEIKAAAIEGLIASRTDWAVPMLIGLLDDPDSHIRSKAMEGLRKNGSENVLSALMDCLSDQGLKGKNAVTLLSELGDDSLVKPLEDALQSPLEYVRERALLLLKVVAPEQFVGIAVRMLGDTSGAVRKQAVKLLSQYAGPEIVKAIESEYPGEIPVFTEIASYLLARIGTDETVAVLMKALREKNDSTLQAVLKGVAREPTNTLLPFLKEAVSNPVVRDQAIRIIAEIHSADAFKTLIEFWSDPEWRSRIDPMLMDMNREMVSGFLGNILDTKNDPLLKTALIFAGRLGCSHLEKLNRIVEQTNPLAGLACRAAGEIRLRTEWARYKPDVIRLSTSELEDLILDTKSLPTAFDTFLQHLGIVRLREYRSKQTSFNREEIEKKISLLEAERNDLGKKGKHKGSGNLLQIVFLLTGIIGCVGTAACFYMNWKTLGQSFWYPAMVGCLFAGAAGFFGFTRSKSGTSPKSEQQQRIAQQRIQAIDQKLEQLQKTMTFIRDPAIEIGIDPGEIDEKMIHDILKTITTSSKHPSASS